MRGVVGYLRWGEASQTNHCTVSQQLKLKHAQVLLSPANNEGPVPGGNLWTGANQITTSSNQLTTQNQDFFFKFLTDQTTNFELNLIEDD